jgi:hypothetical protein
MIRKLVIIAMIMGMAGVSLAVTIGLPTSANSWSTTKYVSVTASSSSMTNMPAISTIDGNGLDSATGLLHSNFWRWNMWYVDVANPNTAAAKYSSGITYGGPAWLVYNFKDEIHNVTRIQIWNYNEKANTGLCIKNCKIEYSTDGSKWTQYSGGASVTLNQASGLGWNDGNLANEPINNTINTGGIQAKYIAIIPEKGVNGNWNTGGADEGAYGLSEIRFIEDSNRATMPEPFDGTERVVKATTLKWVKGDGTDIVKHKIYLGTEKTAVTNRTVTGVVLTTTSYDVSSLLNHSTMYFWAVDELNSSEVKVSGGTGNVWSFATPYCDEVNEPRNTHGNVNSDCFIDFKDFAMMCQNWGSSGYWPE